MHYRKRRTKHTPILIDRSVVEQVESFKLLGIHITNKLTWSKHIKTVVKRARQNLWTKPQETEKIWHGSSDPQQVLQLHHQEHPDQLHHCLVWKLLGIRSQGTTEGSAYGPVHHWGQATCHPGPLYQAVSEDGPKHCQRLQPPSQRLFSLLPHGKRYRSAKSRSKRLINSFYPQAIRLLNS